MKPSVVPKHLINFYFAKLRCTIFTKDIIINKKKIVFFCIFSKNIKKVNKKKETLIIKKKRAQLIKKLLRRKMIIEDRLDPSGMFSKAGRLSLEMYTLLQEREAILFGKKKVFNLNEFNMKSPFNQFDGEST